MIYAQCCTNTEPHSPVRFPPVPARTEHRQKSQLNTCALFLVHLLRIKISQALSFHSIYTRQLTFHLPAVRPERYEHQKCNWDLSQVLWFLFPDSTIVSKEPEATVKYSPFKKTPNSEAHLMVWQRKEVTHDFRAHGLVPIPPKQAPDGCFAEAGHMLNGKLLKRHLCVKPGHWCPAVGQWAGVHIMCLISPCSHSIRHNYPQAFEEMLRKRTFLECFRCGGREKPRKSQDHFGWERPLASKPLACHTRLTINFALWGPMGNFLTSLHATTLSKLLNHLL